MQTTVMRPASCYGVGVHSGKKIQLIIEPAKANVGIVFVRTDIKGVDNIIPAYYKHVKNTVLCTAIRNDANVQISTIEHLMAAIWGCGIDNLVIKLDGPEVPIMDGSSKAFIFMIECAGIKYINAAKNYLKILKEIVVSCKDSYIKVSPSQSFELNMTIDFANKAIGYQSFRFMSQSLFKSDLAAARTFGFVEDLEKLKKLGLARGASLSNAIAIQGDKILNPEGLRFGDEFVRHKILDTIGDLKMSGASSIIGTLDCYKNGHAINNELLHAIFNNSENYSWVSSVINR